MDRQIPVRERRFPFQAHAGFRKEVLAGQIKIGMTCLSGASQMIEIMGFRGLDFICIDTEHSDGTGIPQTAALIKAADAAGVPAIVRVDVTNPDNVLHVLDYGAIGIQASDMRTREDAESLVRAVKYAPWGNRGSCPHIRAARYGGFQDWDAYVQVANEETMTIAVIESPEGIANVADIIGTPGIDVLWVGVGDLAQRMGHGSNINHPELLAAKQRGIDAAKAVGKPYMLFLPSFDLEVTMPRALNEGYTVIMLSCDTHIFTEGVRRVVKIADSAIENRFAKVVE